MTKISPFSALRLKIVSVLLINLFFAAISNAQRPDSIVPPSSNGYDTLRYKTNPVAANKVDSIPVDVQYSPDALDANVDYGAKDSIIFANDSNLVHLYGAAEVKYKNLILTADYIVVDLKNNIATATPMPDSAGKMRGLPTFKDGQQNFTAQKMRYNFRTKKGMVYDVTTKQNDIFVLGSRAKFVSGDGDSTARNDVAYNSGAIFTTCNAPHPHFGIYSSKQKVIPNKLIVVGASNLVLGDVPTPLWLPFGFYPISQGKRTGLIFPRDYTYNQQWGFGFQNVGWYFPLNDNVNLTLTGDVYIRGTFSVRPNLDYVKNYKYRGTFNLGFTRTLLEDAKANFNPSTAWAITWTHAQDSRANPTFSFNSNVNLNFSRSKNALTSNFNSVTFNDYSRATQTQLSSSISFSKSFPGKPYSLSGGIQHSQNVVTREFRMALPDLNFTMQTIFPFKRKQRIGNEQWFEKISLQYASQLRNNLQTSDSLLFTPKMWTQFQTGVSHQLQSNVNFNILKYFNFTPSVQYTEFWYLKQQNRTFDPTNILVNQVRVYNRDSSDFTIRNDTIYNGKVDTTFRNGFFRVNNFTVGASLTTRIFGTMQFKHGWLRGIRHTIAPTVGFSYAPNQANYLRSVRVTNSDSLRQVIYNVYENAVFGTPGSGGQSAALNYSFLNLLELKTFSRKDSTFKKTKLLENINIGGNYNFLADSFRWSNVAMSTGTNFFKGLTTLAVSAAFDPYGRDSKGNRVKDLAIKRNGKLLTFVNLTMSFNTGLSIGQIRDLLKGKGQDPNTPSQPATKAPAVGDESFIDLFKDFRINHQFTISRQNIGTRDTTIFQNALYTSGNIPLSKKWRITVGNIGYDFVTKQMTYPDFGFQRDLHCWEMGMNWQPLRGTYSFYLRVKPGSLDFLRIPYNRAGGAVFRQF